METPPLPPACTKQGHQKPLDSKDENPEKHCPLTVNPWHMKKAFKVMNELRSQNLLCDVTIVAEDMEIPTHRVVLAACSPYFHAMFTGEMSESRAKRVRIKEVDGWTLRMLVDYVYTAEIQVTEENVQHAADCKSTREKEDPLQNPASGVLSKRASHKPIRRCGLVEGGALLEEVLLPAAGLLQLQDVKKTCCEFLESQLHPVNCLGIRAFADMHACTDLLNKANTYAEQHFADVVLSEEFLNLGIEQVCSLISPKGPSKASSVTTFTGEPNMCPRCNKRVYFAEKVTSLGKDWHRPCLRCERCSKTLTPGGHAEHDGQPYCHKPCYGILFGPKGVNTGAVGSYIYDKDPEGTVQP